MDEPGFTVVTKRTFITFALFPKLLTLGFSLSLDETLKSEFQVLGKSYIKNRRFRETAKERTNSTLQN